MSVSAAGSAAQAWLNRLQSQAASPTAAGSSEGAGMAGTIIQALAGTEAGSSVIARTKAGPAGLGARRRDPGLAGHSARGRGPVGWGG